MPRNKLAFVHILKLIISSSPNPANAVPKVRDKKLTARKRKPITSSLGSFREKKTNAQTSKDVLWSNKTVAKSRFINMLEYAPLKYFSGAEHL